MTRNEAKQVLKEYRSLQRECKELRRLYEEYDHQIWRDDEDYRQTWGKLRQQWLTSEKRAAEEAERIEVALVCIPSRESRILRLHYLMGYPWLRVAREMGYSVDHVQGSLHRRALSRFAAAYQGE